jgi:hypothetical protein
MVAMVQQPPMMRLVEADPRERRRSPRREVRTMALMTRLDHALAALQNPRLIVAMRDLSDGGMAAISGVPIDAGERVSVRVVPDGATQGWTAAGRVVRCDQSGLAYRVAIAFDPVAMAA